MEYAFMKLATNSSRATGHRTAKSEVILDKILKMPKIKQLEKCKHPNSRKTKALAKQIQKQTKRDKSKFSSNIKLNLLGEKILWFQQNLDPDWKKCSPSNVEALILNYLARFNEELEQIRLKRSIGDRKNRQHASREDIIKLTVKRETEEYNTCGLEIPNLLDPVQFDLLKSWNGELRYIQNFKLRRFSKNVLKEANKPTKTPESNEEMCTDITENVDECL